MASKADSKIVLNESDFTPVCDYDCLCIVFISVQKLDGSVPVKYGLRLSMDEKYRALKREVSRLADIPVEELLVVEVSGPIVKVSDLRVSSVLSRKTWLSVITPVMNFYDVVVVSIVSSKSLECIS